MKEFETLALRYRSGCLELLDQTLLPHEERWVYVDSAQTMTSLIQRLSIRGAPLLGVGAAMCLADLAERGASQDELAAAADLLRHARPTATNLAWAVDYVMRRGDDVVAAAEEVLAMDIAMCEAMADHGAALISGGEGILTHCNAGGLATAGIGSAIGVLQRAHEQGKDIHVFIDETRPLLQGARLTAWELKRLGIPHTLLCDNMVASAMRAGKIQRVCVGADRVAANGDFANKIGTYGVAIAARYHKIPFHPVAPQSTIDLSCQTGASIPVEQRGSKEVRGVTGAFGTVSWSTPNIGTYNPAFDITPVALVTSLVLNSGVYTSEALDKGVLKQQLTNRGIKVCGQ